MRDRAEQARKHTTMPITPATAISGFIASTPRLTTSENGVARCYVKIGQEHDILNPDTGVYDKGETTFHNMVAFRGNAERIAAQYAKGDHFIAEGTIKTQTGTFEDGHTEAREEFHVTRIGHDPAMTRYAVDRTPRAQQSISGPSTPVGPAGPTNQDLVPPAGKPGRTVRAAAVAA